MYPISVLLLFAFEKLFLKILIFFLLISECKLRNLNYMTDFKFAAGIVLDENPGVGIELYYWWKVQEKNVKFCLIKHVQIKWYGECWSKLEDIN